MRLLMFQGDGEPRLGVLRESDEGQVVDLCAEFLRPGDLMESEVEGIGTLRNRLVAAAIRV